jgi:hypothetical protein
MANEGVLNQISVKMEDTYGVAETPDFSVPILPSDGIRTEQEAVGNEAIDTHPAKNKSFTRGVRNYPGNFEMNAYPEAMGYFLLSALGAVQSAAAYGETTVYEHEFTEVVAKPSMTLEQVIGELVERYAGYICGGFNLQFEVGQPLKFSTPGMGKTVASATKISPAYETPDPFKWDHVTAISVDGVDLKAYASQGNVEYMNGQQTFHGFNSDNEPTTHYVQNSEAKGALTLFMDGDTVDALLAKFRDQNEVPVVITVQGPEVGNGTNLSIQIELPKCVVNAYATQLETDYNKVALDFVAGKDVTDGLIKVTLINQKQTYTP